MPESLAIPGNESGRIRFQENAPGVARTLAADDKATLVFLL